MPIHILVTVSFSCN